MSQRVTTLVSSAERRVKYLILDILLHRLGYIYILTNMESLKRQQQAHTLLVYTYIKYTTIHTHNTTKKKILTKGVLR